MKRRDLIKKLEQGGYRLDRNSKHKSYEKPGHRPVQVPHSREVDENTARRILKDAGLS